MLHNWLFDKSDSNYVGRFRISRTWEAAPFEDNCELVRDGDTEGMFSMLLRPESVEAISHIDIWMHNGHVLYDVVKKSGDVFEMGIQRPPEPQPVMASWS
jgi:hypothetical protein